MMSTTNRLITREQYWRALAYAKSTQDVSRWAVATDEQLDAVQADLAALDKTHPGEWVEFEQPTDMEELDQNLIGWRYFTALTRAIEKLDEERKTRAQVLHFLAQLEPVTAQTTRRSKTTKRSAETQALLTQFLRYIQRS